ncbi:hypothetical protein KEM54_000245 [Ascosphaera aggregata]|nr:hypothetical protein KEM54_000245 [Ascosphaera aggregata]
MADTSQILSLIHSNPPSSPNPDPVAYNYLIPNKKGLQNFLSSYENISKSNSDSDSDSDSNSDSNSDSGSNSDSHSTSIPTPAIAEISLFTAATESFSHANQNASISTILSTFPNLITQAKSLSLRVRAYISVALGCPYEGPPTSQTPHKVAEIATSLLEMGVDEVSIGDTTGMGTILRTRELLSTLQSAGIKPEDLALHFHDTFGMALCNTIVGLEAGIRKFDSSVAGLGGCPYSKGATGNVATEDLVYLVESLGMRTGVDLEGVSRIGEWIAAELGRKDGQRDTRVGKGVMAGVRRRGESK